jgi:digeranylgeranylglycerophospholipid reductase
MDEQHGTDVIVVGAGTAGSYLAWRMAEAGRKVLVLDSADLSELGSRIEIFHIDKIRFDEFRIPHPAGEELIHTEDVGYTWSPDLKIGQPVAYTFYVMHMPSFIRRLQGYAVRAGATILGNTRVDGVLREGGRLVGVTGMRGGATFEARARIVVDATGLAAAVRTRMPADSSVENWKVPPEHCLFVCLELRDDIPEGFPRGSNSYLFHKAFWNKSWGDGAILGIGQPNSFEHAWKKHREWREEYFGDPGRVLRTRQGVIPYHRPPFSLVDDGFMAIGDAACQNKPFSGEGVTSGFTGAEIAAEVAVEALRKGDVSRAALWPYNTRYFRGQGAKFASSLAQLPAVAELGRRDVDFLFRRNIIFSSADFEELNRTYEISMGPAKLAKIGLTLLAGVVTGGFGGAALRKFLAASLKAGKIKTHYLAYPASPAGYAEWAGKAASLWGQGA